jgi:large subunit ribosomal protein L17
MGHQDKVVKLNRTRSHREAMLANMAMSLFTHRLIKTTDARAKALRPVVDRIIVTAKKNTLSSRRQVADTIKVREVFQKLYKEILPHFETRTSGFTRVIKLGVRRGDGAEISVVELLTPRPVEEPADKKDKDKKKAAKGPSKLGAALKSARTRAALAAGRKKSK